MHDPTSSAEDAGRLLAVALGNQALDAATRDLIRRYRSDGSFRGLVDTFARGLGIRVLDVLESGLVLAADADSPFSFRLSDYRANLSVEDRLCHGMVQVAIAAWCFPTAASLEDDERGLILVSVQDVLEYLTAACTELQRRATVDPDLAYPELQEAWRAVLSRPETRDTGDGRRAATSLMGMVSWALERLSQEGFLRKESDQRGGRWHVRPAYRVQVRELAGHHAFRLVSSIHRGET